jgi:hypothetical protein
MVIGRRPQCFGVEDLETLGEKFCGGIESWERGHVSLVVERFDSGKFMWYLGLVRQG